MCGYETTLPMSNVKISCYSVWFYVAKFARKSFHLMQTNSFTVLHIPIKFRNAGVWTMELNFVQKHKMGNRIDCQQSRELLWLTKTCGTKC